MRRPLPFLLLVAALVLAAPAFARAATITKSPGADLNAAYQAAAAGDVIELTSGSYGNVRFDARTITSGEITVRPQVGATVSFNDLLVYGSGLRVQGVTIPCCYGQPDVRAPAANVTIEDVKATNFYVTGATRNVTIKGGEYGPYVSTGGGSQIKTASNGGDGPLSDQPVNTTVDGVWFHDYTVPSGSSAHLDCLHIFHHQQVVVRNSRFDRCQHYGILWDSNGSNQREDGDSAQGNTFGEVGIIGLALRGETGVEAFEGGPNVIDTRAGTISPQNNNELSGLTWARNTVDNIGPCRTGITYQANVIATGDLCGPTDSRPGATADTTPPDTTITTGPTDGTATDATVAFTSSESGSTFECRLDAGTWVSCASPKQYTGLTVGSHTVDVRATDLAGNTDASPASASWSVTDPAPVPDPCAQTAAQRDQALQDLAAMTADRDAWKTRALKAEDQLSRISAIAAE